MHKGLKIFAYLSLNQNFKLFVIKMPKNLLLPLKNTGLTKIYRILAARLGLFARIENSGKFKVDFSDMSDKLSPASEAKFN